jgi:hypothetical protein
VEAYINATVEGPLLAEYVDQVGPPAPPSPDGQPTCEIVPTVLVGDFVDVVTPHPRSVLPLREFIVQTLDNKLISVRGHSIEAGPDGARQVVIFTPRQKICVAIFDGTRILGIYEGKPIPAAG